MYQVNFISQIGSKNACGEACLSMLLNWQYDTQYRIKDIEYVMQRPGLVDTPDHLIGAANRLGHDVFETNDVSTALLNSPAIVLVSYGLLPYQVRADKNFVGLHYVLVVGQEGNYMRYLDPLYRHKKEITILTTIFEQARNKRFKILYTPKQNIQPQPVNEEEDSMTDDQAKMIARSIKRVALQHRFGTGRILAHKKKGSATVYRNNDFTDPWGSWDDYLDEGYLATDIIEK